MSAAAIAKIYRLGLLDDSEYVSEVLEEMQKAEAATAHVRDEVMELGATEEQATALAEAVQLGLLDEPAHARRTLKDAGFTDAFVTDFIEDLMDRCRAAVPKPRLLPRWLTLRL